MDPRSEVLTGIVRRTQRTGATARRVERAEVAFVKNRREEWWECPNRSCGAEILFLMIGRAPNGADPTCFCGSTMKRAVRTRRRRGRSSRDGRPGASETPGCDRASTHPPPQHPSPKPREPSAQSANSLARSRRCESPGVTESDGSAARMMDALKQTGMLAGYRDAPRDGSKTTIELAAGVILCSSAVTLLYALGKRDEK